MSCDLKIGDAADRMPTNGKVDIYWLGGAGFLLCFANGLRVCIDPYLSDSVNRLCGFKRLIVAPISPEQLKCDVLIISHEHPDHLDVDSFDAIYAANPDLKVLAPESCDKFLSAHTKGYIRVSKNVLVEQCGVSIIAVRADHGELSPDALGFILKYANKSIYLTGDTALNLELLATPIAEKPEIIIPCINGAYGNMDEKEAAELVKLCGSKTVIPTHYGLFDEHGGDVGKFVHEMKTISPGTAVFVLTPGGGIAI